MVSLIVLFCVADVVSVNVSVDVVSAAVFVVVVVFAVVVFLVVLVVVAAAVISAVDAASVVISTVGWADVPIAERNCQMHLNGDGTRDESTADILSEKQVNFGILPTPPVPMLLPGRVPGPQYEFPTLK